MNVPVVVEIHDQKPYDDSSGWDHAVEASIEVISGKIVIAGCTDYFPEAMRVEVAPGWHRVRASYGALDTLSKDGLTGDDHYRVQLWPASRTDIHVLKQRSE